MTIFILALIILCATALAIYLLYGRFPVPFGKRHSGWSGLRNGHLVMNPVCVACGTKNNLTVHHIIPVNIDPDLELDPKNLVTMCQHHHFAIGHWNNWRRYNINVIEDSIELRKIYDKRLEEQTL